MVGGEGGSTPTQSLELVSAELYLMADCSQTSVVVVGNQVGPRNDRVTVREEAQDSVGFPVQADRILRRPWHTPIRKVVENIRLSDHVPASASPTGNV